MYIVKKKKKKLCSYCYSSVLAMYFARKQDILQRAVAPSDPPVLLRILCLGLACIMVISSIAFDASLLALRLTV